MAAGAWTVYNKSKKKIGNGTISLASTAYRMNLYTSASNANTATLSILSSVTNQVTGGGYAAKSMTGEVWTVGASAGQYKFDMDDPFWSANGSSITNIKFAVIALSAGATSGQLLCRSQLSTSQFTLAAGNRLTIQMNTAGVLTLA